MTLHIFSLNIICKCDSICQSINIDYKALEHGATNIRSCQLNDSNLMLKKMYLTKFVVQPILLEFRNIQGNFCGKKEVSIQQSLSLFLIANNSTTIRSSYLEHQEDTNDYNLEHLDSPISFHT